MNIFEKLQHIQCEIKAPKNLFNSYGKYKYRNAEGIQEALKPYLEKYKCTLIFNDQVEAVGDRIFLKTNAILYDVEHDNGEGQDGLGVVAYAEIDKHAGMCADQATGCASSYARKYALNALLLLDDTKDTDSDEFHEEMEAKSKKSTNDAQITEAQLGLIKSEMLKKGIKEEAILKRYEVASLNDLSKDQASKCITSLKNSKKAE